MFSERFRLKPEKTMQIDSMDDDLRMSLWICLEEHFDGMMREARTYHSENERLRGYLEFIWTEFFKRPKSDLVQYNHYHIIHTAIRPRYFRLIYHEVYSFVEFVVKVTLCIGAHKKAAALIKNCNDVLERENAGWRFVKDEICPLTKSHEVQNIEEAFDGVGEEALLHLRNMLGEFSKKEDKNYRTVAIEAILALEAYGREVAAEKSMILSELCRDKKLPLHPSLLKGLSQFYAYANDEIRHAKKVGVEDVDVELAKFMMLQSTSYINLIKSNHQKRIIS